MVSRRAFTVFVLLLGLQRLLELRLSRQNERYILDRGGREAAPQQMWWMKAIHAGWVVSMPLEVYLFKRPFQPGLAFFAAIFFAAGQALRYAAIRTLGRHWTVRVMTIPGESLVRHGIYRYLRHPNYLGVVFEIAAAPLLHGAYLTSILFSILNAAMLSRRIRVEQHALARAGEVLFPTVEPEAAITLPRLHPFRL